jgi:hypothetical protein
LRVAQKVKGKQVPQVVEAKGWEANGVGRGQESRLPAAARPSPRRTPANSPRKLRIPDACIAVRVPYGVCPYWLPRAESHIYRICR